MNDYEKYLRDESPTFMGEPALNKQRNYPDAAAYAEATEGVDMADFQRKILATAAPILEVERAIRMSPEQKLAERQNLPPLPAPFHIYGTPSFLASRIPVYTAEQMIAYANLVLDSARGAK